MLDSRRGCDEGAARIEPRGCCGEAITSARLVLRHEMLPLLPVTVVALTTDGASCWDAGFDVSASRDALLSLTSRLCCLSSLLCNHE